MPTYDNAFSIAFCLQSHHPEADDISPQHHRNAILTRPASLVDDELLEAVGIPFDHFVVETPSPTTNT